MTTWTPITNGSGSWAQQETHPYPLLTEASVVLLTESGLELLAYGDGTFWSAASSGSASWESA